MENVQFEEQNSGFSQKEKMPTLNKIVVKLGLAKDYGSSNVVLILIAVVAAILAIGVYVYYVVGYNPFNKPTNPPASTSRLGPSHRNIPINQ